MLKSFCVKTNNENIINYLLEKFQDIKLNNIFISTCSFKIYDNIIIHYYGENIDLFFDELSKAIADCILTFYENNIIKKTLYLNYFYFTDDEQEKILKKVHNSFSENIEDSETKNLFLISAIKSYILANKYMILDGFVNFRIYKYLEVLDYIIDNCVNDYLIEKEYIEFVNLLKIFVNSRIPTTDIIHLIYTNSTSILLDKDLNIINTDSDIFKAKYLSDITFSSNDFALNSLLNLLPKKIVVHIIDSEDDFIESLKLIFEKRIVICDDCNICNVYKQMNNKSSFINKFVKKEH